MTNRATLLSLADRCERASGPDRHLDAEIARVLLPSEATGITRSRYGWSYRVFGPSGWDDEWLETLPFTASLNAAVTLVPEGWTWARYHNGAVECVSRDHSITKACANTSALALCAAALRAMAAAYH